MCIAFEIPKSAATKLAQNSVPGRERASMYVDEDDGSTGRLPRIVRGHAGSVGRDSRHA